MPAAAANEENQPVREISQNSAQNQLDSSHPAENLPDEPLAPDNRILGINIHRTDHFLFSIRKIVVKCSVVNEATGRPIQKSTSDRAAVSFYETQRQISFIMPVLTRPFQVEQEMSLLPKWDELIEINEQFEYIVTQNPILLFEVQQCLPENLVTCAWAYLRLRGTVATVDQQIRLQLFSPPKQRDASKMTESCLSLLKGRSLLSSKINSSLHVTICRLTPFNERENRLLSSVNRSMRADQSEARDFDELGALTREQSRISRYFKPASATCVEKKIGSETGFSNQNRDRFLDRIFIAEFSTGKQKMGLSEETGHVTVSLTGHVAESRSCPFLKPVSGPVYRLRVPPSSWVNFPRLWELS